jgi:predicted nucleic acid-binding protein
VDPPLAALLSALLDTNVLIRHLTAEPPEQAERATRYLATAEDLLLTDVVAAECVYVLGSVYGVARQRMAQLVEEAISLPAVRVDDERLPRRALALYEGGLDFAEAYLVATGESTGIGAVASFDRGLDRVAGIGNCPPAAWSGVWVLSVEPMSDPPVLGSEHGRWVRAFLSL